ncbi:MAG: crossover junction endodeoxyribonuclease RuvC, partial [Burkholderiales bacterium]|nr:crossover junction endodeoxyribonuclease RuvC [Burkholderiales bacterium]
MRILGIDPGSRITGFGVIDVDGQNRSYVASGCIRTPGGELAARIKSILRGITEVVETYKPDVAAVEIVFVNVNPQSTLMLGQARGAAMSALVLADLPIGEYTA